MGHPIRFTDLSGGVPDSVRTHTLVLILRGEVAAAGDYYLGDMLSWRGRQLVSDNNFHVAVRNDGRIFDAFTGAVGMTWAEYQAAMTYLGTLQSTVIP